MKMIETLNVNDTKRDQKNISEKNNNKADYSYIEM